LRDADPNGEIAPDALTAERMNQKELKELIEYLVEKDIAEFEYERGDVKVRVVRPSGVVAHAISAPIPMQVPTIHASDAALARPSAPASAPAVAAGSSGAKSDVPGSEDANLQSIKSPIVGTFYECPSPGAPAFVKEGDRVTVGQVLCIIEAMKLMNEIESEYAGTIVKRFVNNGQPVEYGQKLFSIRKD
jgi:acetyl-CoA carboxylase biotin carboxyl carrier protein